MLRQPEELDDPGLRHDEVYRLRDARLVFADHRLLQHDFPWLRDEALIARNRSLERLPKPERCLAIGRLLDRWLLENAAFISSAQKEGNTVNEPIRVEGGPVRSYRPTRYGRALVVDLSEVPTAGGELRPSGLLDLKGAGVALKRKPNHRPYGSGLYPLSHALQDTLMQWAIDEAFRRAAPGFHTVPVYGVIAAGFGIHSRNPLPVPAAIQVRRAHRRPLHGVELPDTGSVEARVKFEIEMVLRRYGITSNNHVTNIDITRNRGRLHFAYGNRTAHYPPRAMRALRAFFEKHPGIRRLEGINVQLARECGIHPSFAQVVDFGHYRVARDFEHPVANLVRDRMVFFGGAVLPESRYFVRPHPRLALPYEVWGEPVMNDEIPKGHHPILPVPKVLSRAFSLAYDFDAGKRSGPEVFAALRAMLDEVLARWEPAFED